MKKKQPENKIFAALLETVLDDLAFYGDSLHGSIGDIKSVSRRTFRLHNRLLKAPLTDKELKATKTELERILQEWEQLQDILWNGTRALDGVQSILNAIENAKKEEESQ